MIRLLSQTVNERHESRAIDILGQSTRVTGPESAHVTLLASADSSEEAKEWLARVRELTENGTAIYCTNCVENNKRFEDARQRFEIVAARIKAENEQLNRSLITVRNQLRDAVGENVEWLRETNTRLAQDLQTVRNEAYRVTEEKNALAAELERTKAALKKAEGTPMKEQLGDASRFSRLEVD